MGKRIAPKLGDYFQIKKLSEVEGEREREKVTVIRRNATDIRNRSLRGRIDYDNR